MKTETLFASRQVILPVFFLFVVTGLLHAQAPGTGAIAGKLSDPSGAVVSNARLRVVSEETNLSRGVTTTAEGLFRAPLLLPGNYSVVVEVPGFERKELRSVRVAVAETTVVNITLQVGGTATAVEVSGSPELVQTESAALGRPILPAISP